MLQLENIFEHVEISGNKIPQNIIFCRLCNDVNKLLSCAQDIGCRSEIFKVISYLFYDVIRTTCKDAKNSLEIIRIHSAYLNSLMKGLVSNKAKK